MLKMLMPGQVQWIIGCEGHVLISLFFDHNDRLMNKKTKKGYIRVCRLYRKLFILLAELSVITDISLF